MPVGEIMMDTDRIQQVILNLLSNAVKFCPEKGGEINLSLIKVTDGIEISVKDNGKGIDEEQQEMIFDKFFQAKNQNIKKPKGSGLGLAISKNIVMLHGGKIGVESQVGKGARFWFTLPLNNNALVE
jgi:signal transduction histidine kinase